MSNYSAQELTAARAELARLVPKFRFTLHLTNPSHPARQDYRTLEIEFNRELLEERGVKPTQLRESVRAVIQNLPFTTVTRIAMKPRTVKRAALDESKLQRVLSKLPSGSRPVLEVLKDELCRGDRELVTQLLARLSKGR